MKPYEHNSADSWSVVYTTNTLWEAELVCGYLHARGIEAVVLSQVDSTRAFTVGLLAIAKVYVPTWQLACAQEALREYESGPSE